MTKHPKNRITSIKEIAKIAGCSIATVSNTLNNRGRISQKVREKVMEICENHGYIPNSAGRNLRRRAMETVGLLFYPSTSAIFRNVYYAEIMEALEATLKSRGFDMLLSGFDLTMSEQHTPRFIRQGKVDGIILLGGFPRNEVQRLLGYSIPLLHLDNYRERIKLDYVTSDGYNACGQVMDHLVNLGHRRIVFMAHAHEDTNADQREAGFLAGVKRHNLPHTLSVSIRDFYGTNDGYDRLKPLLESKRPPTAIICVNDTLAVEILEKLQTDGYQIPSDLTLFGYNDDLHSRISNPPISTLKVDMAALGRIGAETILKRIQNPETPISSILLPVELVHRGSEGPPKA